MHLSLISHDEFEFHAEIWSIQIFKKPQCHLSSCQIDVDLFSLNDSSIISLRATLFHDLLSLITTQTEPYPVKLVKMRRTIFV